VEEDKWFTLARFEKLDANSVDDDVTRGEAAH
jgi:hypothetical protein